MHIGEKIRHGKMRAGLSMRLLAEHIGVTAPAIGNSEKWTITPDSIRLISLAQVLDLPIYFFFR